MSGGPGSLAVVRSLLVSIFSFAGACIVLDLFLFFIHGRWGLGVGTHIFIYDCPIMRPSYQKHCLCRHVYANDPTYTY